MPTYASEQELSWNNRFTAIYTTTSVILLLMSVNWAFFSLKLYLNLSIGLIVTFWLALECFANVLVVIKLKDGVLTVSKPLRGYSLFFRKRPRRIVVHPDEWNELRYYSYRKLQCYYFRQSGTPIASFKGEGLETFQGEITTIFHGNKISALSPAKLREHRRAFRKACPQRSM